MPRRKTPENCIFLLHPTRRKIYQIICENPGNYFYRLMQQENEEISSATLLYHLSKLEEAGLIKSEKIDGKRIYFPKNLRSKKMERAYMLLKNENAQAIFLYILNHGRSYQNEIAKELGLHHDTIRHHIVRLVDAEMLVNNKEGRRVFYSMGEFGTQILEGSMNLFSEAYIRFIISKLADNCHFPEIISRSKDKIEIRVVCPHEDDIYLSLDISGWSIDGVEP